MRTAEEDGERVVEELGGLRIDDVAALQFPCFREELTGCFAVLAFAGRSVALEGLVLVGVCPCSCGTDHSLPDAKGIGP